MVEWTSDEKSLFQSFCKSNDLEDLKDARFRRLVRLAHTEGLLPEILCEDKFPAEGVLRALRKDLACQKAL